MPAGSIPGECEQPPAYSNVEEKASPQAGLLLQGVPNPLISVGRIRFRIPGDADMNVNLSIYDVAGRHVRSLVHCQMIPGEHIAYWNKRDEHDLPVSPGLYFYRLSAAEQVAVSPILVLR